MSFRTSFLIGFTYVACIFAIRIGQNLLGGGDIGLAFLLAGMMAVMLRASIEIKHKKPLSRSDQMSLAILVGTLCLMMSFIVQVLWQTFVYPEVEVPVLLIGSIALPFILGNVFFNALQRGEKLKGKKQ